MTKFWLISLILASSLGLLNQCAERNLNATTSAAVSPKVIEAFIQEEIPGQENQVSKWMFTIQINSNEQLETLNLGDQTYKLFREGKSWKTVLNQTFNTEKEIPKNGAITYKVEGKTYTLELGGIALKEPLYLP